MNKLFLSLALVVSAPVAVAQNCFDGDWGTLISTNPADVVLPIQPIGFAFPLGGATFTDCHITDHGYVQLSNAGVPAPIGGAALWTPTAANLVAGSPKICCFYADIVGTGGGQIYINSSPTKCVITWRSMQNYGIPLPRFDFQVVLLPSGTIRCVYGVGVTNASTFGGVSDNGICGVSPGGGAILPASSDLSLGGASVDNTTYEAFTLPATFDLANNTLLLVPTLPGYTYVPLGAPANCASSTNSGTGCGGLALTGQYLPSIDNANFRLRITGIPIVSPIAFVAFGSATPFPIDLGVLLGMTGCFAYQDLSIGLFGSGPVAGGASSFPLGIANNPALVGALLSAQGVSLTLANPFGFATSNLTSIVVGYGAN